KVPDEALLVARDIINHMLAMRADIRGDIIERGGRVGVMGNTDSLITEFVPWLLPFASSGVFPAPLRRKLGVPSTPVRQSWNRRADGAGGAFTICFEENLLGYPGTFDFGENILVHELAHNIYTSLRRVAPTLNHELEAAFK